MERRDFFSKTGYGVAGVLAAKLGSPESATRPEANEPNHRVLGRERSFAALREDFPALERMGAYLDTAFVGLMPAQVKAAHDAFLEERFQWGSSPREESILGVWMNRSERVRAKLAAFLGAAENEIAFTYCTGCGSNIAINGIDWRQGDNAVIDDIEYPTDFHVLNALKHKGVEIRIARSKNGAVAPDAIDALVDGRTRAVVVTHVSYLNGFRHDLQALSEIIHARGGYLIVDSAQAVGGISVNVRDDNVDFLSGIPYKWLGGPNGVGFLYVREELIPRFKPDRLGWSSTDDFLSLDTMESKPLPLHARRFEYGTLSFEGVYALEAALDYVNAIGIEAIERHNLRLIELLRKRLEEVGARLYTPEGNRSPILSFFIDDERSFGQQMKKKRIHVTARRWRDAHVRVSPHFYNTEDDIEAFIEAAFEGR